MFVYLLRAALETLHREREKQRERLVKGIAVQGYTVCPGSSDPPEKIF